MQMDFEFEGLDDLIKRCEEVCELTTINKTTKKALNECGELAYHTVQPLVRRAEDHSKSGAQHKGWGYRQVPSGHAADNIPLPILRKKKDFIYVVIGWERTDNSPFFYEKFEEWGTSQRPPYHAFGCTSAKLRPQFEKIIMEHFEELLKKAIEG